MKVLFIGGTGKISYACLPVALGAGHQVTIFNRGRSNQTLPAGVELVTGDINDRAAYQAIADQNWDVVCQFIAFRPEAMARDIEVFSGKVGQYVFISSASVYKRRLESLPIREAETPIENPYWAYSQAKIACEELLKQSSLAWTIVRPSQTMRTTLPTVFNEGDLVARRMLEGKPNVVMGDGSSFWTLTRAQDVAVPFVRLLGNPGAIKEDFHITGDVGFTWDHIYQVIGSGLGVESKVVHVATDTLVRYNPDWIGPLLGDKIGSVLFDNSKIKRVAGDFTCETDLSKILGDPLHHLRQRLERGEPHNSGQEAMMDRICRDQVGWGA